MPASIASNCSWLKPLKMSDVRVLNSLSQAWKASASAADVCGRGATYGNGLSSTETGVAWAGSGDLSSGLKHKSVGNSDIQRGGQSMPFSQIARDDEEIRCVSPSRVVSVRSSRVLPFPSSLELSTAERLRRLEDIDPEGAAMITRLIHALHDHAAR
jgi:hypothetical protein